MSSKRPKGYQETKIVCNSIIGNKNAKERIGQ